MMLIKRNPFGLNEEVNTLLSQFLNTIGDSEESLETSNWPVAVDIKENDNDYTLFADLPGVDRKDIEISVEDGFISIKGERGVEKKEENSGYTRIERVKGKFYRRFTLPESADTEHVSAKTKNGVLEVIIPKKEITKNKKIKVNVIE